MSETVLLLGVGLLAGVLSGLFGIGGGLVIVPALLMGFKMPLHKALGTSLGALLLPVGLLGAWEYWRRGDVDVKFSALIAAGLFVGAFFGAKVSLNISAMMLRRLYAIFLVAVAARLLLAD